MLFRMGLSAATLSLSLSLALRERERERLLRRISSGATRAGTSPTCVFSASSKPTGRVFPRSDAKFPSERAREREREKTWRGVPFERAFDPEAADSDRRAGEPAGHLALPLEDLRELANLRGGGGRVSRRRRRRRRLQTRGAGAAQGHFFSSSFEIREREKNQRGSGRLASPTRASSRLRGV